MDQYEKTKRNSVVRVANRGRYDKDEVFKILDTGFVCHISFVVDDQPFIIPTIYGRDGESIYLHGSVKSRMINVIKKKLPISIAVTYVDGIVLARSVFHHSANYRSVVLFGTAEEVTGTKEKMDAFRIITEQVLKGRWDEARHPNKKELAVTSLLKFDIESASAKIRAGGPVDDKEDYDLDIWAGVLPYSHVFEPPIPDDLLKESVLVSDSVRLANRD